jgi:hypothetical protein
MQMHWPEATQEQYDAVRRDLNWMENPPRGGLFHASYFADDGFHAVDVWQSDAEFQDFVQTKLMAAVAKVELNTQPDVKIYTAHTVDPVGYRPR